MLILFCLPALPAASTRHHGANTVLHAHAASPRTTAGSKLIPSGNAGWGFTKAPVVGRCGWHRAEGLQKLELHRGIVRHMRMVTQACNPKPFCRTRAQARNKLLEETQLPTSETD